MKTELKGYSNWRKWIHDLETALSSINVDLFRYLEGQDRPIYDRIYDESQNSIRAGLAENFHIPEVLITEQQIMDSLRDVQFKNRAYRD